MAGDRYIADPPGQVRKVELEGLTALFHARSGMTHILAPPAPQILEVLGEGPADAAEILARLSRCYELSAGTVEEVEARLAELAAAGLVARQ